MPNKERGFEVQGKIEIDLGFRKYTLDICNDKFKTFLDENLRLTFMLLVTRE